MSGCEHDGDGVFGVEAETGTLREPESHSDESNLKTANYDSDRDQRIWIDLQMRRQKSVAKSRVNDHQKHETAHFAKRRFSYFEPFFDKLAQNLAANERDYDRHRKLRENGAKTHRCRLAHERQKQKRCREDSLFIYRVIAS